MDPPRDPLYSCHRVQLHTPAARGNCAGGFIDLKHPCHVDTVGASHRLLRIVSIAGQNNITTATAKNAVAIGRSKRPIRLP